MKYYVVADMEGISGIYRKEQVSPDDSHYAEGRKLLTEEVNAVVSGLLDAGAEQIIVKDAHFRGSNLIVEELHPGAVYCMGGTGAENRFPGLDSTFAGALLVGYHAMGGVQNAVIEHTMSSKSWTHLELNGRPVGEIALDALLFGLQGVPVVFVSGDDKTCEEAKAELAGVSTYATKIGIRRNAALLTPPKRSRQELRKAVCDAAAARANCKPLRMEGPYEMTVHFLRTELADTRHYDGVGSVRVDGLTARYADRDLTRLLVRGL